MSITGIVCSLRFITLKLNFGKIYNFILNHQSFKRVIQKNGTKTEYEERDV